MICRFALLVIAVKTLQLRVLVCQFIDPCTEGMHIGITGTVDKMDRALCRQCGFKHAQGRCNAHATADQHQRFVAVSKGELASRREQLQGVAHTQTVMQEV